MHAVVHLITRDESLTFQKINEIMAPYYEEEIFKYDPEKDEYTEPDPYPPFRWDYYTVHYSIVFEKPEDCFVLIDPDGHVEVRNWWNGKKHINRNKKFEKFVKENRPKWKGCYMAEIDIHW